MCGIIFLIHSRVMRPRKSEEFNSREDKMVSISLRFKGLLRKSIDNILEATKEGMPLRSFITPKAVDFEEGRIDLKLDYAHKIGKPAAATLEELGAIFDLLGIFPRTTSPPTQNVTDMLHEIHGIKKLADRTIESVVASRSAGTGTPYESAAEERSQLIISMCDRLIQSLIPQK